MKYRVAVTDVKGEITIERTWWGNVRIEHEGKPLQKLAEKHFPFALTTRDGKTRKLYIRAHYLDPVPAVKVDDQEVLLERKLHWLETLFAALPIGMFIGHGIPSTLLGFFVVLGNFNILRSKMHPTLRWLCIYLLSLAAYVGFAALIMALRKR